MKMNFKLFFSILIAIICLWPLTRG
ncbi:MAG: hypothetical protein FD151_1655, partial [bacterium]